MPQDWPKDNATEAPETNLEILIKEKLAEILRLKREIVEEEDKIARTPHWLDKDIAQNLLDEKRGRLKMRVDEYDKLKQKIH